MRAFFICMINANEQKFRKVIGWITLYNQRILKGIARRKSLRSAGVRSYHDLFDLRKYTPQQRFEIFSRIPGLIEQQVAFENLTPTVGFAQITKAMSGNIAAIAEIKVNYHALGTGSTAPAAGDTQLQTEAYRKLLSSQTYANNKAYYTAFYTAAEVSGTFDEIGLFINGSAAANSGILWDRSLLHIVKQITQTLTIDYEDTFSNG